LILNHLFFLSAPPQLEGRSREARRGELQEVEEKWAHAANKTLLICIQLHADRYNFSVKFRAPATACRSCGASPKERFSRSRDLCEPGAFA